MVVEVINSCHVHVTSKDSRLVLFARSWSLDEPAGRGHGVLSCDFLKLCVSRCDEFQPCMIDREFCEFLFF